MITVFQEVNKYCIKYCIACGAGGLVKAKKVQIPSVRAKRLGREQGKTACRKTKLFRILHPPVDRKY